MSATNNTTVLDGTPTGIYAGSWREVWRINEDDGRAFRVWTKLMPRIDDTILHCAIYLYISVADAKAGICAGGSGFFVGVPFTVGGESYHIYAVTAAHVIEGRDGCAPAPVVRLNTQDGNTRTISYRVSDWKLHPAGDDVAVVLTDLEPGNYSDKFEYIYGTQRLCITKTLQEEIVLGAGDDIFMIGRFTGRNERQSNIPLVRFGHIAGPKDEPINQGGERTKRKNFIQDSFLVEVHSLPGFSGSPVFVSIPPERVPRKLKDEYSYPKQIYLLGIDWGFIDENNFPGVSGVVPAWKLLELLNDQTVVQMRKEREKELASRPREPHGHLHSRVETQQTLAKNKRDRIDIPVPGKSQFEHDLTKAIRKRKD